MRFETDPDFRNPSWDLPRSQIGSLSFHGITTDGLVVEVAAFGIFEGGTMSERMSRRGLFSFLSRPLRGPVKSAGQHLQTAFSKQPPSPLPASGLFGDTVAVVQGRHCLAYHSVCSVCYEHCPVPGAFLVESGIPSVVAETCTGCQICHQVCPAPTNAILILPRRKPGNQSIPETELP